MTAPNQRRLLFKALLMCLWLPVFFLSLELYARVLCHRAKAASEQYNQSLEVRRVTEAFHDGLWITRWESYKPGASVSFTEDGTTYRTSINNLGFRGRDFSNEPGRTAVVACLGGSTTVEGPVDDETYPAHLERFLNGENGRGVRVVNGGMGALISDGYLLVVPPMLEKIRPDYVVEYNFVNDVFWLYLPHWKKSMTGFRKALLSSFFVRRYFGGRFLPEPEVVRQYIRENTIARLKTLAGELEGRGVRLCVCSFLYPDPGRISGRRLDSLDYDVRYRWFGEYISYRAYCDMVDVYNEELAKAFAGTKVIHIPLAESGIFTPDDFFDICHMRPSGIEKKARLISNALGPILRQ